MSMESLPGRISLCSWRMSVTRAQVRLTLKTPERPAPNPGRVL